MTVPTESKTSSVPTKERAAEMLTRLIVSAVESDVGEGDPVSASEPHGLDTRAGSDLPPQAAAQLQEAFRVFTDASTRFSQHYALLEGRVAQLNLELEEANARLRLNLMEKQKVQEYLSALVESLPIGVIGTSPKGVVESCNRRAAEILEQDAAQACRRSLEEVLRAAGASAESVAEALAGERRGVGAVEIAIERPSDGRRRVLRVRLVPTALTSAAEPLGSESPAAARVVLIEDVTDIRRLEHQADRNNRLTAMGEIAMNVAHEIRNPLGSIELFASMLQRELAGDPSQESLAAHICSGVRCVDHIVANILQFARPQRLNASEFDLRELIDETLVFAEHAVRHKRIAIERGYTRRALYMKADAELLKQMFLNLFLNAIQATPEGGAIGVESIPNGRTVEIRVWDTGCGLGPDIIGRIFDPFFTTRRKGTGLGLTIVHNIVSAHQGSIDVENRPEGGALFSIVLPKRIPRSVEDAPVSAFGCNDTRRSDTWEG
ncbi:PAS domain-containing protein [Candidatus Sumerlaeota bacterium]|nr:PAS domain-containing protein [Candidatus Sumerlaeota bacterium]